MDLGSSVLSSLAGRVTFLSENNTRMLAHHGSDVTLQCQVDKPPNSAMVSHALARPKGLLSYRFIYHVEDKAKSLLDAVETPLSLFHFHTLCLIGLHHVVKLELSRIL